MDIKRKAQASVEFLTTYGWVLLSIVAALSLIMYFGFSDLDPHIATKCDFADAFECVSYTADTSGDVLINIRNMKGEPVELTHFSCMYPQGEGFRGEFNAGKILNAGDSVNIGCRHENFPASLNVALGKKEKIILTVYYIGLGANDLPRSAQAEAIMAVTDDITVHGLEGTNFNFEKIVDN